MSAEAIALTRVVGAPISQSTHCYFDCIDWPAEDSDIWAIVYQLYRQDDRKEHDIEHRHADA